MRSFDTVGQQQDAVEVSGVDRPHGKDIRNALSARFFDNNRDPGQPGGTEWIESENVLPISEFDHRIGDHRGV